MTTHSFDQSLRTSQEQADAPWWEIVYRHAFLGFASMTCVRKDGWAQRGGIDRVITLQSGKTITVDEKVRKEDWPDILLEYWSDADRKEPGWVSKDLACDYIAYAFVPSQTCWLLPALQLRRVWRDHGPHWLKQFKSVRAYNEYRGRRWTTVSVAVPTEILMGAIEHAMCVRWSAPVSGAA